MVAVWEHGGEPDGVAGGPQEADVHAGERDGLAHPAPEDGGGPAGGARQQGLQHQPAQGREVRTHCYLLV